MTPRTIKLNAHRTLTYYTPEDVERIIAERLAKNPISFDHIDQAQYEVTFDGETTYPLKLGVWTWLNLGLRMTFECELPQAATQNVSPNRSDQQQHRTTL